MELYDGLSETTDRLSFEQLNSVFRDITLAIGGVFYAFPVPEDAVWEVARSLDRIFRHALPSEEEASEDKGEPPPHSQGRKHPAIVELLRKLKVYGSHQSTMDNKNV